MEFYIEEAAPKLIINMSDTPMFGITNKSLKNKRSSHFSLAQSSKHGGMGVGFTNNNNNTMSTDYK
jgi:hypothetical protein